MGLLTGYNPQPLPQPQHQYSYSPARPHSSFDANLIQGILDTYYYNRLRSQQAAQPTVYAPVPRQQTLLNQQAAQPAVYPATQPHPILGQTPFIATSSLQPAQPAQPTIFGQTPFIPTCR